MGQCEVLNDDNLLIEILIRVGFPTTLVRAALVCKRWYHHASDRGVLCRFRKRNPPRLLGLYIDVKWTGLGLYGTPQFVPMQPQTPELDNVVRRVASHSFDAYDDGIWIMHCQNGSIFTRNDIIVLDLATSSFSRILLPQGVKYHTLHTILSPADDASGLYLIHVHVKEHQLCIWLHKGDNWLLVDTLCLHQMWANLRMRDHTLEDEDISYAYISQVGDNVQFVFLKTMCGCILYLDVTSRTLHKVHGMTEKDRHFSAIYPFMMIWPPIFPALKDDQARQGSWVEMGQPETVRSFFAKQLQLKFLFELS
uniref:Uncharacterized protein n=1 Tax=Aegilops tauschii TaxID=37682 RepID=N1R373_AEGTA